MMMKQGGTKHLTILHSNDLHGDFLAEKLDNKLVGGVAMLSGYVNRVRREQPNTLYLIAGDMFRGSLIDTEFQGISTIEIMNALGPDVVSLGNHELDYGIAHLLFLERCCKFPIVNANIYVKPTGARLFKSHTVLNVDGIRVLVIGIVTDDIMGGAKSDKLLGTFVDLTDAAEEVGLIINSYKTSDIDLTVLLTHIGFDNDCELAKKLDPEWGIDLIIGGHSHTLPPEPVLENGILIVQAGVGTDQIGRFDLEIDTAENRIAAYRWETVPIDHTHCERNTALETLIHNYKRITDNKYNEVLTTLCREVTHPGRYQETEAGNLFADMLADCFELDLAIVGSGSLRMEKFGPVVTKGNLLDMHPFDEKYFRLLLSGAEIKHAILNFMRNTPTDLTGHSEYYQISRGWRFVYRRGSDHLETAEYHGAPIPDDEIYKVGLAEFHRDNLEKEEFFDLNEEIIQQRSRIRTLTGNIRIAIEEYMRSHVHLDARIEGRTELL